jgi:hypothetical protein
LPLFTDLHIGAVIFISLDHAIDVKIHRGRKAVGLAFIEDFYPLGLIVVEDKDLFAEQGSGSLYHGRVLRHTLSRIAPAAAVPALLYYLGMMASVRFRARTEGLEKIPKELIPSVKKNTAEERASFRARCASHLSGDGWTGSDDVCFLGYIPLAIP